MASSATHPVRVMLVGDCPLLRSGFRQVLEAAGISVVASVGDAIEAASLLRHTPADAIVMGTVTRHPAVDDMRTLARCPPSVPVLVLGRSGDPRAVRTALDAGARGYLGLDDAEDADLIEAVRRVAAGEPYVRPKLPAAAAGALPSAREGAYHRLSERERQVLRLVAGGRSNREIAAMLGLSANTIAAHRANVMKTLSVRKTAALVLVAVRHGLVTAD